jgi:predicted PurR-regulated permease PerM
VLAFIVDPAVEWLIRRGNSRTSAVVYVFIVAGIIAIGTIAFIVPMIYVETVRVVEGFPVFIKWIGGKWQVLYVKYHGAGWWIDGNQAVDWMQEKGPAFAKELLLWAWTGIDKVLSAFSLVIGLVVIPIYTYYFLTLKPRIRQNWRKYVPLRKSKFREEITEILVEVRNYLAAFFRGQLINSLVLGVLATIGLSLAGVNYALLLGVMTGVLSLIPYLGVFLSGATAVTIAYFQGGCWWWKFDSGNWSYVLVVFGIYVLVQQCEAWFITPRIQGRYTGLHPMTIIVSLLFWSVLLGGVLGALLAVPLTAILKVLMFRYVWGEDISNPQKTN